MHWWLILQFSIYSFHESYQAKESFLCSQDRSPAPADLIQDTVENPWLGMWGNLNADNIIHAYLSRHQVLEQAFHFHRIAGTESQSC